MSRYADFPKQLKPREKFMLSGGDSLSSIELLAIVLSTGTKDKSVMILAHELLEKYGGIEQLIKTDIGELCQNIGIGESKAIKISALGYINIKISDEQAKVKRTKIKNSQQIYDFMKPFAALEVENFHVICLNSTNIIISYKRIFKGSLNSVNLNPREIFKYVLQENAAKICLVHNHPSGEVKPSNADIQTTKYLIQCANSIGIEIVDHIIIGRNNFCSLREKYDIIF